MCDTVVFVLQFVSDKIVCVTKLCVTKLDLTKLCGSVEVREEEVHAGYRSKTKNPTQFCGE